MDCMVSLPAQLFYATQIPDYLWFLAHDKPNGQYCNKYGTTLFIDARKLWTMVYRVHDQLTETTLRRLAQATIHGVVIQMLP